MKLNKLQKLFLFFLVILFLFIPCFVLAIVFTPEVSIPGGGTYEIPAGQPMTIGTNPGTTIFKYFAALYSWGIRAIGVIAVVMIMIAGFQWMLAGGNATAVSAAKERMKNSVMGLILIIGAYWLLNFINPALVQLPKLTIKGITGEPLKSSSTSTCQWKIALILNPTTSKYEKVSVIKRTADQPCLCKPFDSVIDRDKCLCKGSRAGEIYQGESGQSVGGYEVSQGESTIKMSDTKCGEKKDGGYELSTTHKYLKDDAVCTGTKGEEETICCCPTETGTAGGATGSW